MATKRKKIIKIISLIVFVGILAGAGVAYYLFNLPHRDVQASETDFQITVSALVNEYLSDQDAANSKYLVADGNSKILEVTGTVVRVSENFNGQKVVLLREDGDEAGINFTFNEKAGATAQNLEKGQTVTIKGVIRSGVYYDKDLDMYVHAVVDHSSLIAGQ
jgi:hypothetical protein